MIGNVLKIALFGESHADAIGCVVNNMPSGFEIDMQKLKEFTQRRVSKTKHTTQRKEKDNFEFLSGYYNNKTTGTPLCIIIKNNDALSKDYDEILEKIRPSHSDYTGNIRYLGYNDVRGSGHFSGRITAPLCVAGGIAMQILEKKNIYIYSHIKSIKDIQDISIQDVPISEQRQVYKKDFQFFDDDKVKDVKKLLDDVKNEENSVGGIVEIMVHNMKDGIGSPYTNGVRSRLSQNIFAIPSIVGLEFGSGFESTLKTGYENNDSFQINDDKITTITNNSGGINGNITNGMPIILKVGVKPTPSIGMVQYTINIKTKKNTQIKIQGRHDSAIILRIAPVLESMVAITLLDMMLEDDNGAFKNL